ncbi:MAG: acyl-CoA dehydrogenase family protein [Rubrivivax sp.]
MNPDLRALFDHLLGADPRVADTPTVQQWAAAWPALCAAEAQPFARALRGGFAADRAGWAFAAGYQAALAAQLPQLAGPDGALLSLSVTEAAGNRPRDLRTRAVAAPGGAWRLHGAKRWATLAPVAAQLVVIAVDGGEAGRPALGAYVVPRGADGLSVQAMPPTPFAPEVPHAEIALDGVLAAQRLDGDAYERLVKPFRTVEDLYVNAALVAWLLREARARGWPPGFVEQALALTCALAALSTLPAEAAATHLALDGALQGAATLYDLALAHGQTAPASAAAHWSRDRALSGVAAAARRLRTQRARERLGLGIAAR